MKVDFIASPGDWIQQPTSLKSLRGKVVLIDFWDYTCINCTRTDPYLKEWYRRYHEKGLEIVGVHTPEFEFARNPNNVREAVKRNGFTWHIVNDPKKKNWYQFGIFAWPQRILVDPNGAKQLNHIGEGNYGKMEQEIQREIKALHPQAKLPPLMQPVRDTDKPGAVCRPVTPEIYTWIKGLPKNQLCYTSTDIGHTKSFAFPKTMNEDVVYLSGNWLPEKHDLLSVGEGNSLALKYRAKDVNIVLEPSQATEIEVLENQKAIAAPNLGDDVKLVNGKSVLTTNGARMYSLLKNKAWRRGQIELRIDKPGLKVHSFSFGTDCSK
jgi:thiol-disulfide isomerase/thioredoxin